MRRLWSTRSPRKKRTQTDLFRDAGKHQRPPCPSCRQGKYTKLTWDSAQHQLAFLSSRDDPNAKPAKFNVYLWNTTSSSSEMILSSATPGFRAAYGISEGGSMNFSRDGARLFVNCAPLELMSLADRASGSGSASAAAQNSAPPAQDEKVLADLWHYKDDFVQPNESGRMAIGMDDRAYRHLVDYDSSYSDVYLVDTSTGTRKLALPQIRGNVGRAGGGGFEWSPDGTRVLFFKDKNWFSLLASDGSLVNLTSQITVPLVNEGHDTPDAPPPYGTAGWTKDSRTVLIYDHDDVWAVSADGTGARRLTDGRGEKLQFRVTRMERPDSSGPDSSEERGIDPAKPIFFRVENQETHDSGVYSLPGINGTKPARLLFSRKNYGILSEAKNADVILMTATTFHDQPDLHVTNAGFQNLKQVTEANPQQKELLWGPAELIHFKNTDGVDLQAALYKPENFDPAKKYPMIIYIYERLSQNVNSFVRPGAGTSTNISYTSATGTLS